MLEADFIANIDYCLNRFLFSNAIFLAERLYAETNSEDSLRLLANTYLRSAKVNKAYSLLKCARWSESATRYLLAYCSFELGKFREAEDVLLGDSQPHDAASLHLLGMTYKKSSQRARAVECFRQALLLNPYLWSAREALNQLGEQLAPQPPIAETRPGIALIRQIGKAHNLLCQYQCHEAISEFQSLSPIQQSTGFVLCLIGRAYFELGKYVEAQRYFDQAHRQEPYRTEGMELYSTILWHLRKDVELSYLAHHLVEFDRRAPESWCAVGNCFSLQKEHKSALKAFQRALQLDSHFTYAYTLSGHEYIASDDLEHAISCFRTALRFDTRHYNAWFGLGLVYFRQGKFDIADFHFRKALAINPTSSVLHCYSGMASFAAGRHDDALVALDKAISLDPMNTVAKYKRAVVLTAQQRLKEALFVLQELSDMAPREAPILFLMGKVCKKLGLKDRALVYLSTALDIDTKNANTIKAAIDKLHLPDSGEDDVLELQHQ